MNLTETLSAMSMITKAGVPSNMVVLGVASYARSFQMSEAGCYGAECFLQVLIQVRTLVFVQIQQDISPMQSSLHCG